MRRSGALAPRAPPALRKSEPAQEMIFSRGSSSSSTQTSPRGASREAHLAWCTSAGAAGGAPRSSCSGPCSSASSWPPPRPRGWTRPARTCESPPPPLPLLLHIHRRRTQRRWTAFSKVQLDGCVLFYWLIYFGPRCADVCKSLGSLGRSVLFVFRADRNSSDRLWWKRNLSGSVHVLEIKVTDGWTAAKIDFMTHDEEMSVKFLWKMEQLSVNVRYFSFEQPNESKLLCAYQLKIRRANCKWELVLGFIFSYCSTYCRLVYVSAVWFITIF